MIKGIAGGVNLVKKVGGLAKDKIGGVDKLLTAIAEDDVDGGGQVDSFSGASPGKQLGGTTKMKKRGDSQKEEQEEARKRNSAAHAKPELDFPLRAPRQRRLALARINSSSNAGSDNDKTAADKGRLALLQLVLQHNPGVLQH